MDEIPDSPFEIPQFETEQSRQQFPLGKAQRYFLYTGRKGSYPSKKKIEDQIDRKLNSLGDRLQDLIDDIGLLYYGGFLSSEHWDNGPEQLTGLKPRRGFREEDVKWREYYEDVWDQGNHQTQLEDIRIGFSFGQMVKFLYSVKSSTVSDDLLWGLILGLAGQSSQNVEQEQEVLESLLARAEMRIKSPPEDRNFQLRHAEHAEKSSEEVTVLPASLRSEIYRDDTPLSQPILAKYCHEDEIADPEDVEELSEQVEIVDALRDIVFKDADRLELKKYYKREATDAFRIVWTSTTALTSKRVARQLDDSSGENQYGKLMNDLTGDGTDGDYWEQRPLLERQNGTFTTTAYGDLFGYCLFRVYNVRKWMHATLIGREESFLRDSSPLDMDYFELETTPASSDELLSLGLEEILREEDTGMIPDV